MPPKSDKSIREQMKQGVDNDRKLEKKASTQSKSQEAHHIASHFSQYLKPLIATSDELMGQSYAIRHSVYCEELAFEAIRPNGLETDEFDRYSVACLIQHVASSLFAGTVRMVQPKQSEQLLPIEKYALHAISDTQLLPTNFERHEICEISRLAVPASFRRRNNDKFDGVEQGAINPLTFSKHELRCFPFIAVGLYLTATALIIREDIKHIYVMVEPRLARNMRLVGIKFKQIGPIVDYHGQRAVHYIDQESLRTNLTGGFAKLRDNIIEICKSP